MCFLFICYRPQRSCGQGYVFTRVCDPVHKGESASVHAGILPPVPPEGGMPQRRPPRRRHPSRRRHPPKKETPRSRHPKKETPQKEAPHCQGDPPEGGNPLPRRPQRRRHPPKRRHPLPRRHSHLPGPHPRGKLRGIRSRPTTKGEIEGDQVQAHTRGGN